MASNVQAGTRGLSAGDWIRLKRLQGARNTIYYTNSVNSPPLVEYNKDITNSTLRLEPESGRRVYTEFGTSKIRRPASSWTDFVASQKSDYVLETQNPETKSRSLDIQKVCSCGGNLIPVKTLTVDTVEGGYIYFGEPSTTNGLSVGTPVTLFGFNYCDVTPSKIFYIIEIVTDSIIVISDTPNGAPYNLSPCTTEGPTVTILKSSSNSAIKHNGRCIKCVHDNVEYYGKPVKREINFYNGELIELQALIEADDEYAEINATSFDFYVNETNYGDGNNGGIFMNSNNILHFGQGDSMCCPDDYNEFITEWSTIPKFAFSAGDRSSIITSQSPVITVGAYQYIVIVQSWNDHDISDTVPSASTQIRLIRNTVTGEQWIEYRIRYITYPYQNIFAIDLLSGNQQEQYFPSIAANSGFSLVGNATGTQWTFQQDFLVNV